MEDNKVVKVAAYVIIGTIVAPIVINAAVLVANGIYCGIGNGINKIKFNRKIKKGLEDGSIIELDGEFYEVKMD